MKSFKNEYLNLFLFPMTVGIISYPITLLMGQMSAQLSFLIALALYSVAITIVLFQMQKKTAERISDHDKEVIEHLINILNLDHVEESLNKHDAVYGYKIEHIIGFGNFCDESRQVKNRITDQKIQKLILETANSYKPFDELTDMYLFGGGPQGWITFANHVLENPGLRRKQGDELNKHAKFFYERIIILVDYLKRKNALKYTDIAIKEELEFS